MICSYLLHGYDVILILKLHRRTQLRFVLLYTVWEFEWRHTHVINMNRSRLLIFLVLNISGLWRHMLETCQRLKWLCRKHSNNVARHDKAPVKLTLLSPTKIFCRATWVSYRVGVTLCCDFYKFRSCNTCTFSLTTSAVLRHTTIFCCCPVYYKTLKFTGNTRLRFVFSIQNSTRLLTSFLWFQNSIDQAVS